MVLSINDVCFRYSSKIIFQNLDFECEYGQVIGISGHNGCGKTTLLKLLAGLLIPQKGTIKFELPAKDKMTSVAGLIETPFVLNNLSGWNNLDYYLNFEYDKKTAEQLLSDFKLLPEMNTKVKNYSLGMRQKIALSIGLLSNAGLYLFDEPTNSLDTESVACFTANISRLAKQGALVIIVSHTLQQFGNCFNSTWEISDGRLLKSEVISS